MATAALTAPSPTSALSMRPAVRAAVLVAIIIGLASLPADSLTGAVGASLFVFGVLASVMAHEAGHALAAWRAGMAVTDFWVGMGPVVWGGERRGLRYGLRLFPIGGFISIPGMAAGDTVAAEHAHRTYRDAAPRHQLATVLAGPAVNVVLAVVAIAAAGLLSPVSTPTAALAEVAPGSAAADAGLAAGDEIVAVDGAPVAGFDELEASFRGVTAGDRVALAVRRSATVVPVSLTMPAAAPLGATVATDEHRRSVGDAAAEVPRWLGATVGSFRDLVTGDSGNPLVGAEDGSGRVVSLVGATRLATDLTEGIGFVALLELLALINIFLALFNVLPVPPLDGGHAVLVGINAAGRRLRRDSTWSVPARPVRMVSVAVAGSLLLIGLCVLVQDLVTPAAVL